jgi:hypothetical protein
MKYPSLTEKTFSHNFILRLKVFSVNVCFYFIGVKSDWHPTGVWNRKLFAVKFMKICNNRYFLVCHGSGAGIPSISKHSAVNEM